MRFFFALSGSLTNPESPRFQLKGTASMAQLAAFIAGVMRSQTQMGLRIERQRRPVETLVIDAASLPSES